MRYFVLFLLTLTILSCKNKLQNVISFDLIDISMDNGWTDIYSLKINKEGRMVVYNYNIEKGNKYFQEYLSKTELDSISQFSKIIISSKLDTDRKSTRLNSSHANISYAV